MENQYVSLIIFFVQEGTSLSKRIMNGGEINLSLTFTGTTEIK